MTYHHCSITDAVKTELPFLSLVKSEQSLSIPCNELDLNFSVFPELVTERLLLREPTEADAKDLFEVYSNESWLRYWGQPVHRSLRDTECAIARMREGRMEGSQMRWAICLRSTGQVVGTTGFCEFKPKHRRGEIAYEVARSHSGKGYAVEALRAMILFAFNDIELHTIEAGIDPDNVASLKVVERLGFEREGYLQENYYFDGHFYDTILYSLRETSNIVHARHNPWPTPVDGLLKAA